MHSGSRWMEALLTVLLTRAADCRAACYESRSPVFWLFSTVRCIRCGTVQSPENGVEGQWGGFGARVLHGRCERKASVACAKLVLRRPAGFGVYRCSCRSPGTSGARASKGAAAGFGGRSGAGLGLGQDGAGRARLMGSGERSGIGESTARRGKGREGRGGLSLWFFPAAGRVIGWRQAARLDRQAGSLLWRTLANPGTGWCRRSTRHRWFSPKRGILRGRKAQKADRPLRGANR